MGIRERGGEREREREREKATYVGKDYGLKETVYKYKWKMNKNFKYDEGKVGRSTFQLGVHESIYVLFSKTHCCTITGMRHTMFKMLS